MSGCSSSLSIQRFSLALRARACHVCVRGFFCLRFARKSFDSVLFRCRLPEFSCPQRSNFSCRSRIALASALIFRFRRVRKVRPSSRSLGAAVQRPKFSFRLRFALRNALLPVLFYPHVLAFFARASGPVLLFVITSPILLHPDI